MKASKIKSADLIYTFQNNPLAISEKYFAQAMDQCRYNPRVMEVCTEFVRDFWWMLQPVLLNAQVKKSQYPFVLRAITAVIWDHCHMAEDVKKDFFDWMTVSCRAIPLPPPQLLYVGLLPVASKAMQVELEKALPSFRKCNLIAKDLPFNKDQPGALKSFDSMKDLRLSEVDLLKSKYTLMIKNHKAKGSSNEELIRKTGINRVFLSKILNNQTEGISAEYLAAHLPPSSKQHDTNGF